ncbi:MAG: hypothetical protein AUI11_09075 [Acidobacteria bacterium 13_2_20CM_2_66_4]|nr:MAG: hypothetical protein AUI11_09075 [Acidobacteria bacterium 13_2_20CM_2_66_4]
MLTAISRYGARVVPNTEELVAACKVRGEFIQGAQIAEFEDAFARRAGGGIAVTAAYGRMAFYYMLKALDLPRGSEIIFPSLTFWVVPELAKVAGLTVVFADVDPKTFTIDAASVERVITEKTRVIVPTHLYGLSCDMDKVEAVAARHNLVVIEDCAHALGATFKGRAVGTFGSGALFSFQTLKPLNCYGGGAALLQDRALAAKVRAGVDALPWPSEKRVTDRLLMGRLQRIFIKPWVFSISLFPVLWIARARRVDEPRVECDAGRSGAGRAVRLFARVLPVLRVRTRARRSRRARRPMCAARRRYRDASRRRAARHGAVCRRGCRSHRRAPRISGDSDPGVFEPHRRAGRSCRDRGTRRARRIFIAGVARGLTRA